LKECWGKKFRERKREGMTPLYRSGDMWVSVFWSIVPAFVLSCVTILDVAIALCNGKRDCTDAISPDNLLSSSHNIIAL
jgi:hypothetical protein